MSGPVPINLVVEDSLSEATLRKILDHTKRRFILGTVYGRCGNAYIRQRLKGFNYAARRSNYVVLVDLDRGECAPALIENWLPAPKSANLVLRVAVREVEAWLIAHRQGLAAFLGIAEQLVPVQAETLHDPKETLVGLARRSPRRSLREAIVPSLGRAKVGPDYNGRLISFVTQIWNIDEARRFSPSLDGTVRALARFGGQS
jgi:hypothetical protein